MSIINDKLNAADYGLNSTGSGPQIGFYGDSLTAGSDGAHPPDYYITLPAWGGEIFTKQTAGVPSRTLIDMSNAIATDLTPNFAQASGMNIVVLWGGINDIGQGASPQEAYSRLVALARHLRWLGWQVFVCTLTSAKNYETQREAFNALVYASWRLFADNLVDLAGNTLIGADGAWANGTYFQTTGDAIGIHLTDAGYAIVGGIEQAAICGYLSSFNTGHSLKSIVQPASRVTLSNNAPSTVTSLTLPCAGLWEIKGNVISNMAIGDAMTCFAGWISPTAVTFPAVPNSGSYAAWNGSLAGPSQNLALTVGDLVIAVTGPTTVYLTAFSTFTVGNAAYGALSARRV